MFYIGSIFCQKIGGILPWFYEVVFFVLGWKCLGSPGLRQILGWETQSKYWFSSRDNSNQHYLKTDKFYGPITNILAFSMHLYHNCNK